MARPIKWSRDLHSIRDRARSSKTETWSRRDLEQLFDIGRASSQTLMKAVGEIHTLAGAHFVERGSLLEFLDEMIFAPEIESAYRHRLQEADAPPKPTAIRVPLPADLKSVMIRDLPPHITAEYGRLEIRAGSAESMLESLTLLAQALQNDPTGISAVFDPPPEPPTVEDIELENLLRELRK